MRQPIAPAAASTASPKSTGGKPDFRWISPSDDIDCRDSRWTRLKISRESNSGRVSSEADAIGTVDCDNWLGLSPGGCSLGAKKSNDGCVSGKTATGGGVA